MSPLDWLTSGLEVLGLRGFFDASMRVPPPWVAAGIALLAGISTLLGHSAMLFINRVRGWRFAGSLLLGGVYMTLLYIAQGTLLWVVAPPITGTTLGIGATAAVALSSTAPMMLGLIELFPHIGLMLGRILQGWSLLCLWGLTMSAYATTWWQGLLATALCWLAMQVASRLLADPVLRLVTGTTLVLQARDILSGTPFIPNAEQSPSEDGIA